MFHSRPSTLLYSSVLVLSTELSIKSHIATDGQSVSLDVEPHIYYSLIVTVLFSGVPSLKRGRVSLLHMLHNLSRVRVPLL
jgi:archaellum biogenesis ATPase FlaH